MAERKTWLDVGAEDYEREKAHAERAKHHALAKFVRKIEHLTWKRIEPTSLRAEIDGVVFVARDFPGVDLLVGVEHACVDCGEKRWTLTAAASTVAKIVAGEADPHGCEQSRARCPEYFEISDRDLAVAYIQALGFEASDQTRRHSDLYRGLPSI